MDLLLLVDDNKSHYVYIKDFDRFMFHKTKNKNKIAEKLDYDGIEFRVFGINVFRQENGLVFPLYASDQKFKDSMDLLLFIDDDKSHYVYIKDFDRFMFHKTKIKNKKSFCRSCLQCFSSENVLIKHNKLFEHLW